MDVDGTTFVIAYIAAEVAPEDAGGCDTDDLHPVNVDGTTGTLIDDTDSQIVQEGRTDDAEIAAKDMDRTACTISSIAVKGTVADIHVATLTEDSAPAEVVGSGWGVILVVGYVIEEIHVYDIEGGFVGRGIALKNTPNCTTIGSGIYTGSVAVANGEVLKG